MFSILASMERLRIAMLLFVIIVLWVRSRFPFFQCTFVCTRFPVNEQLSVTLFGTDVLIRTSEVILIMYGVSENIHKSLVKTSQILTR